MDKLEYYFKMSKNFVYAVIIVALFSLLCDLIVEYKVVQNRKNYEMFELCYNVKGTYFCDKSKYIGEE